MLQPDKVAGNIHRFYFDLQAAASRHAFTWSRNKLAFASTYHPATNIPSATTEKATWVRSGPGVPQAARENVRLNLWLYKGAPPTNGQ